MTGGESGQKRDVVEGCGGLEGGSEKINAATSMRESWALVPVTSCAS